MPPDIFLVTQRRQKQKQIYQLFKPLNDIDDARFVSLQNGLYFNMLEDVLNNAAQCNRIQEQH